MAALAAALSRDGMTDATKPRPFAYLSQEAFAKLGKDEKIAYLARAIEAVTRDQPLAAPEQRAVPESRPERERPARPDPKDGLHPSIQRLVNLAPRIRMKAPFRLKATGSRVEGVTTHDYSPAKRFAADFGTSPPTWRSNDDEFWKGVMAVLLHPDGDERTLAHFLSPKSNATATPPPREEPAAPQVPAAREKERPSSPPRSSAGGDRPLAPFTAYDDARDVPSPPGRRPDHRSSEARARAPSSRMGLVVLFFIVLNVAAYGTYVALKRAPDAEAPRPPVAQVSPKGAAPAAPEQEGARAPEAAAPTVEPSETTAAASGASAPAEPAGEPALTCYKDGDTLTVRGTASKLAEGRRLKEVWVFTATSPICVAQGANSETMISTLQLIGKPPPADVPLELTGELVTSGDNHFALEHRIRVKQGRRLN